MPHGLLRVARQLTSALTAVVIASLLVPQAARASTVLEGESMRLRPSGRIASDATASGGRALILRRRASASKQLRTEQVRRLLIVARGERCRARSRAPRVLVRVDGRLRGHVDVPSPAWARYAVPVSLAPGRHRLKLSFTNQRRARRCGRALRIDSIVLEGPPPVVASTPAAPSPSPAVPLGPQPPALFVGDFETGGHEQWGGVQEASADRIQVVQAPVRQGRFASRHEVRAGDAVYGGARAELVGDRKLTLQPGSDLYFGWSTYFPADFPSPPESGNHSLILQWKDEGTGVPPLVMDTTGERISVKSREQGVLWSTPLVRGVWHDFVVHVVFSPSPSTGLVEVWHNGQKGLANHRTATLNSGESSYLKLGYYRSSDITPTGVLYQDGMRVGTSAEAAVTR